MFWHFPNFEENVEKINSFQKLFGKMTSLQKFFFKKWPTYVIQSAMCWGVNYMWYKYFSTCFKVRLK